MKNKKSRPPLKILKTAIYSTISFISAGAFALALVFYAWFGRLFFPRTNLMTTVRQVAYIQVDMTQAFLIFGVVLIAVGVVYLHFAFKEYEKYQYLDY